MTHSGLDNFLSHPPTKLKGKKVGVLCHAASVTKNYIHILDALTGSSFCSVGAIFGPQHGLFGQTQDNMIEWEGEHIHPHYNAPVYSLYGKRRKPSPEMLRNLDALIIDLQDVGARPYTYIWTVKLCMEACQEMGIPLWIFDRPNPVAMVPFDGPLLEEQYFSFVGGLEIPLCHRLTIGEMALLLQERYFTSLELEVLWMKEWWRNSLFTQTGLPWVLPSPNMPTEKTAVVYPGMVLFEGTNVSEGRGSTIPFELFGAPYVNTALLRKKIEQRKLPGCVLREHNFLPTFQKWKGQYCFGMQIHITNPGSFKPVYTAATILEAIIKTSPKGSFSFTTPPYEYEYELMPFDILSGNSQLRECLERGEDLENLKVLWQEGYHLFQKTFDTIAHYPEMLS